MPMNGFVAGPPRSFLDTRQYQRVSVRISDLAGGCVIAFARIHAVRQPDFC